VRVRGRKGGEGREGGNERGREGGLKECGSEGGKRERETHSFSVYERARVE